MISITHWHHICYNWQYKGCQVANTSHVPHTTPHIVLRCSSHSPHMFLTLLHMFLTMTSHAFCKCEYMGHLLRSTPWYQKTFTCDKTGLHDLHLACRVFFWGGGFKCVHIHQKSNTHIISLRYQKTFTSSDKTGLHSLHLACIWLAGFFDQFHRQGGGGVI